VIEVVIYCFNMEKGLNIMKEHEKIERVFTKDDCLLDYLTNKIKCKETQKWFSKTKVF